MVIVGAGPVGLTAALDLGLRGIEVVLLDDADRIGEGSRGICYAKRTLEILDRLGVGEQLVAKGLTWKLGESICVISWFTPSIYCPKTVTRCRRSSICSNIIWKRP